MTVSAGGGKPHLKWGTFNYIAPVSVEGTACVLPVKSVTGLFVTLLNKSRSRCRKEDAGSRLRRVLEAVLGSLQNTPESRPPFCPIRDDEG